MDAKHLVLNKKRTIFNLRDETKENVFYKGQMLRKRKFLIRVSKTLWRNYMKRKKKVGNEDTEKNLNCLNNFVRNITKRKVTFQVLPTNKLLSYIQYM